MPDHPTPADRQAAGNLLDACCDVLSTCELVDLLAAALAAARQEGADAEALRWATGLCSRHRRPDPECEVCTNRGLMLRARQDQLADDCARLCPHCAAGSPAEPGPRGGARWEHAEGWCRAGRLRG